MLILAHPTSSTPPACMDGMLGWHCRQQELAGRPVVVHWHGSPFALPDLERLDWVELSDGWRGVVADDVLHPWRPDEFIRRQSWSLVIQIEDGRGRVWHVPAIVHPSGGLAVCVVRRLVDGQWQREATCDLQRHAVDAAMSVLPNIDSLADVDETTQNEAICTILEATQHLSAEIICKLGLIDDTLVHHGLRVACGKVELPEEDD